MSARRPRVKAAAILKPRRPLNTNESNSDKAIHIKTEFGDEKLTDTPNDSTKLCSERNGNGVGDIAVDDVVSKRLSPNSPSPQQEHGPKKELERQKQQILLPSNESKNSFRKMEEPANDNAPSSSSTSVPPAPLIDRSSPKPVSKPSTSFRRISAPPVNIMNRRRSIVENRSVNCSSPKYIRSPSYSFVSQLKPDIVKPNGSPHHNGPNVNSSVKTSHCDEEVFSPASTTATAADNDECFKSPPFMSPIYTPRRIEPSMSPFHDIYGEDYTKSPSQLPNHSSNSNMSSSSNAKLRQRIRPTPCFANRRNSIQGNSFSMIGIGGGGGGGGGGGCESEDEQYRRQRHYSTSSNHSAYNPALTPQQQRNYFGLNKVPARVRTESYSSSVSDMPFSKTRRSHRSEEYQRVANAKREFNQRLNGKPPDKTRLTMYDLIYYNPLTNPMSKPAGKVGGGDGKNGDAASIASAKTNQSRESMKTEASIKSERLEANAQPAIAAATTATAASAASATASATANGPVPQLKLDVNGEIILDEKSLVIETTANKEAREVLASSDVIYDDEFSGTSGFYKRQKRTRDWLPLETLKFYRSLQTIGTDFSVMLQLFPNRSRRDLKLKFKKEEKHNMALINKALLHPKEFNVDELKLQFDKEDEEIEQKKQEWAEVRKRLASERREQLNASKRRNPNKQISRTMRSMTDGDILYENEFVALPPKSRRNRKRNVKQPDDSVFSPPSINHNNNHVDTLPQHTYATHKLPNFLDMIAAQHNKSQTEQILSHTTDQSNSIIQPQTKNPSPNNSNKIVPVDYKTHNNHKYMNIESDGNLLDAEDGDYAEESMHAMDLSTTTTTAAAAAKTTTVRSSIATSAPQVVPVIIHRAVGNRPTKLAVEQSNNGNDVVIGECANEPIQIGQYIAKNPNLTFKGTGDIMNMDIIFENVSIEEDTSIGQSTSAASSTNSTNPTPPLGDFNCSLESSHDGDELDTAIDDNVECAQQVEHVNINGVHYQIITIENETISDEATAVTETFEGEEEQEEEEEEEFIDDDSATSVIVRPNDPNDDCVMDTNMMMISNLDFAAEVETAGDMDDTPVSGATTNESTAIDTLPILSSLHVKSEMNDTKVPITAVVVDTNDGEWIMPQRSQTPKPSKHTETNTANDRRKRKPKIVPLLANNKRMSRNTACGNGDSDGKTEYQLPQQQQQQRSQVKAIEPKTVMPSKLKYELNVDTRETTEHIESLSDQAQHAFQYEQDSEQAFDTFDDNDVNGSDIDVDSEGLIIDEEQTDADDAPERSFLDSLVVVESQDPNEPNQTIHEVFVVDPDTNEMSEKPLDLPDHVIQRIRLAIS